MLATANQLLLAPARMAAIEDAVRFYKEEAIAQEGANEGIDHPTALGLGDIQR
ncbi:hypothetical protein [Mycobacteroides abscessus]|uniref:hypothetical protein n=1 Tax=Mycobacteroides abscessus TaxID=36809 RepID=UPI0013FCFA0F|nr:hypothetical protein [Mycobacteroides abscessus]